MRLGSAIFKSMEACLNCNLCVGDVQVTYLMGMILRILLRWIDATCRSGGDVDIQFGSYNMNREDCAWLYMLIFSRLLAKCRGLIGRFGKRVTEMKRGSQQLDLEYLEQVARGLFASLNNCARHFTNGQPSTD
jgi:hypothetical protein